MDRIKIAILGGEGRMGRLLTKKILNNSQFQLVGTFTESSSENLEKDIGSFIGQGEIGITLIDSENLQNWLKNHSTDIIIDFSSPKASSVNCQIALQSKIPCVIGTTGLSQQTLNSFESLCIQLQCSCVIASNMMRGVNIFFHIAELIASYTKNWDVEIIETHHRNKIDSPSGTALHIGKRIAQIYETDLETIGTFGRKGKSPRKESSAEIGIHSIRGGDIVGEHKVLFAGSGERIELVHRAHNREGYAEGALTAAKYLYEHRNEGAIFSMEDVLALHN